MSRDTLSAYGAGKRLEAGDRVQIANGKAGEIVIVNDDRTLAYVRLDESKQAIHLRHCPLDGLTKIDD